MYRAREDRAASKFHAKKANDKAERLRNVLENGREKVARMLHQADAVCLRYIPAFFFCIPLFQHPGCCASRGSVSLQVSAKMMVVVGAS